MEDQRIRRKVQELLVLRERLRKMKVDFHDSEVDFNHRIKKLEKELEVLREKLKGKSKVG